MEGKELEQMQIKSDCSGERRGKDKTVPCFLVQTKSSQLCRCSLASMSGRKGRDIEGNREDREIKNSWLMEESRGTGDNLIRGR